MSGKRPLPKLGEYYAKMLAHCPQAITAYGACIKAAIDAGALEPVSYTHLTLPTIRLV